MVMTMSTRTNDMSIETDAAYEEGKRAFRKDYGSHGPTVRDPFLYRSMCPYVQGSALAEAWRCGYAQDVRRVDRA